MNNTLISKINYRVLIFILFFMPYSTFVLQLMKHYFETLFGYKIPTNINFLLTGWKEELLLIGLLLALFQIIKTKKWIFKITKLDIYFIIFASVLSVYGYILNPSVKALFFAIRYDFLVFGFYWLARTVNIDREDWLKIVKKLLWFSLPIMIFGILQSLIFPFDFLTRFGYSWGYSPTGNPLPPYHFIGDSLIRAFATFPGPNSLAMYCGLLILILIYLGREMFKAWQSVSILCVIGFCFILTYSRSHLLSVIMSIIFAYVLIRVFARFQKGKKHSLADNNLIRISLITAFCVAILFVFVSYLPKLSRSFSETKNGVVKEYLVRSSSTNLHDILRSKAWADLKLQPWGYGVSSAGLAMTNLGGPVFNPESSVIIFMYEYGFMGLIGLLILIYLMVWTILKMLADSSEKIDKKIVTFLLVSFFAILIGTFFLPCWYEVASITWWILFGLFFNVYLDDLGGVQDKRTTKSC